MKRVVRSGCFETNSSSMHSIIITKNDNHLKPEDFEFDQEKDDEYPEDYVFVGKDGEWRLWRVYEGFGRHPFQFLTTFQDKFTYALCEYLGDMFSDEDEFDSILNEFENIATDVIPGCGSLYIDTKDESIYLDENGNEIKHKDLHYDYWDKDNDESVYYYLDENGNKHTAKRDEENYYEAPNIGSIDHQSAGLLKNFFFFFFISLKEFLTN